MRWSHGALRVSNVRGSSWPATRTTARSHVLNCRPAGPRGQHHALRRERLERDRLRGRVRVARGQRREQRLVAQRVDADAVRAAAGRRPEHDRGSELARGHPSQQLRRDVLVEQRATQRRADARRDAARERPVPDVRDGRVLARRAARVLDAELHLGERTARPARAAPRPPGVSSTCRVVRRKRTSPRSRSSSRIARESGDCDMYSRSAARPKCSSSATATK